MVPPRPLLFLSLLTLQGAHGCQGPEVDREFVLAKVKALILDALDAPAVIGQGGDPGIRRLPRRHAPGGFPSTVSEPKQEEEEDSSQVILFPATGSSCDVEPATAELGQEATEGLFTYVFRPSQHTRSRQVISAQLWFHTGLDTQVQAASNGSGPLLDLMALSFGDPVTVPVSLGQAPPRWAVLHLATSTLPLLTHPVLVLMLRCPLCTCSARPEDSPFLVAHTQAGAPERGRRAPRSTAPLRWPWSPAALRLLQRSPEELTAHANCHRVSLNISFQELGWNHWIVHPPSFIFYYCRGSCETSTTVGLSWSIPVMGPTPPQPVSLLPGAQPCCAALPGTLKPLRVRTTLDGGYTFKYEVVPNLLAQYCTCL
ncbi:PREDICTED: inhibin alpha chain [Elephantulus edwardii]|uniref:inhibin alpha chain n=1 Tax=Elephantulus edwardii TaxID=28737 RepID=UPI0003F0C023|nr:PREDICTED: inhibin alpha chain [Elephantulus edwardii]